MKNTVFKKRERAGVGRVAMSRRGIYETLTHEGIPEFMIRLVGISRLKRVPTEMVLKNRHD